MGDTRREWECSFFLSCMDKIGPGMYDRLLQWFGSAEEAWKQSTIPVSGPVLEEWHLYHSPGMQDELMRRMERMEADRIRFITREQEDYPQAFLELADPPIGVFLRGRLPGPSEEAAAIIGARRCTPYGKACASKLASELARQQIWVISGMALGIDAWAQWAAVDAGGPSLAVLGSGVDVVYPASHRRLYDALVESGGVLSEYAPGVQPLPFHFPLRNRLISALSGVVVVVEAQKRSGTLITVDQALEQGREVLAVPGRIDDVMSEGCCQLLRQGAGVCLGAEDIYYALGWPEARIRAVCGSDGSMKKQSTSLSAEERKVFGMLTAEPVHVDELMRKTNLPMGEMMVILWNLEAKKLIRQVSGGTYHRIL